MESVHPSCHTDVSPSFLKEIADESKFGKRSERTGGHRSNDLVRKGKQGTS